MNIYTSTKAVPYVYYGTHKKTKKFYIGYRKNNVELARTSDQDLPLYKTSSKEVKPIFEQFDWIILAEFENGDDAYDFEQSIIFENWGNLLLINKSCFFNHKRFRNPRGRQSPKKGKPSPLRGRISPKKGVPSPNTSKALKGRPSPRKGIPSGMKGVVSPFKGTKRPHLSEVKRANPQTPWNKGKKLVYSEEYRQKLSFAASHRSKKLCPHCLREIDVANFARYHGDACKLKI